MVGQFKGRPENDVFRISESPVERLPKISQPDQETDEVLFDRFLKEREQSYLAPLLQRHQQSAFRIAFAICGRRDLAEDVVQEAFIRIIHAGSRFQSRGSGSFRRWLAGITVNEARRMLRKERRLKRRAVKDDKHLETVAPESCPGPEIIVEQQEHAESFSILRRALDTLDTDLRIPIVMYYLEGLSQSEISRLIGVSQSGVSGRLERGLQALRHRLQRKGVAVGSAVLVDWLREHPETLVPCTLQLSATGILKAAAASEKAGFSEDTAPSESASASRWVFRAVAILLLCLFGIGYGLQVTDRSALEKPSASEVTAGGNTVYHDHFDGDTLDPFWETAEPADQVRLKHPKHPSCMVLSAAGANRKPTETIKLKDTVTVLSRALLLGQDIIYIRMETTLAKVSNIRTRFDGKDYNNTLTLLDEKGNRLECVFLGPEGMVTRTIDNSAMKDSNQMPGPVSTISLRAPTRSQKVIEQNIFEYCIIRDRYLLITSNGGQKSLWRFPQGLKGVRLMVGIHTSKPGSRLRWGIDQMKVRRLTHLPENARRDIEEIKKAMPSLRME